MENNYYSIAMNDLQFLQAVCTQGEYYNNLILQVQQVVEKLLKSLVDDLCTDTNKILKSHHLRGLYNKLEQEGCNLNIDKTKLAFLEDFYFDARYPGDNFVNVTKDDFDIALDIMYNVVKEVNDVRDKLGKKTIPYGEIKPKPKAETQLDKMRKAIKETM